MPLLNRNRMRLSARSKGFGDEMEIYAQVLDSLELIKDLLVGLAWPAVLVFLLIYFRAESKRLFDVIARRLEKTSQLELPGGIKAIFAERPQDVAKRVAHDVLKEIGASVPHEKRDEVQKQIESVLYSEEARAAVLLLVTSQGIVSRQRAHSMICDVDPSIAPDDVDNAILSLKDSDFISEDKGKLSVTPRGERVMQARRLEGDS